MKTYIGKKTILAMPMAKSEAEKVLNRSLAQSNGGEEGYLIQYYDGYKSWSPKNIFERSYRIAETSLDLMRIESAQLKNNIMTLRLSIFTLVRKTPKENHEMLQAQLDAMLRYDEILDMRIKEKEAEETYKSKI